MKQIRDAIRDLLLNIVLASPLCPWVARRLAMRSIGMDIGRARIKPRCFFGGRSVSIGTGTFINYNCFFDASAPITVGTRCSLAMGVSLITSSHQLGTTDERAGTGTASAITIGDGSWLGANVTVLPGVTIGAGTVIAAGAVVVADCDADSLYAGVPAVKVRALDRQP